MNQSKENKVIIDGLVRYGGLNQPNLKFIKVNVDCWEKIFDFLPLCDILAMSQTCQRMQQIGGHYFRENFHGTEYTLDRTMCSVVSITSESIELEHNDFLQFIDTMSTYNELEAYEIISDENLLRSIRTLKFYGNPVDEDTLLEFGNGIKQIETIYIGHSMICDNFADQLLKSCPNLKRLLCEAVLFESNEQECGLFHRTFPMLEHFQYTDCEKTATIVSFLELNPTIKSLHIRDRDLFSTPKMQLDCLKIEIEPKNVTSLELANRIKALHANGGYKTLHLFTHTGCINLDYEAFINQMASFRALKVLCVCQYYANICQLTHLKELHIERLEPEINLETLAKNLQNLERLYVKGTVDQLITFLRFSKSLKMIIFRDPEFSDDTLNLFYLNKMRKMSGSKRKVRIGLYEEQYLATKWKVSNGNCDLVEVTRIGTICNQFDSCDTHL